MLPRTLLALVLLATPAVAQLPFADPALTGYVTALTPAGAAFELEGIPVVFTPKTIFLRREGKGNTPIPALDPLYFGQSMEAWGKYDKKTRTLTATHVVEIPPSIAEVRGGAMIDFVPVSASTDHVLRADGYTLHLTPETKLNFNPPLTTLADLTTNVWIEYRGVQQLDGSVTVNAAEVWPNTVPHAEDKLRTKREFDPAAVTEADKQSGASKFFLGYDAKKFPAHQDEELQARVNRIGQSLIPAYQRALPASDPGKINFRFQVVETEHFRDAITFANGIILVPWPAIGRLQNDSQIATVLADNIACALEKQEILHQPTHNALTAANWAGVAAGFVIPGAGLATGLTTGAMERHALTMNERQSGRVSLTLLHDAGYELHQAPIAWRLLEPKKEKPLATAGIGDRSNYLYAQLGNTWHEATPAPQAPALP